MSENGILIFLAIGAIAGWLAGQIIKGGGFGLIGNIIIGIVGSVLGGFIFRLAGINFHGIIGSIICATFGAVLMLYIIIKIRK